MYKNLLVKIKNNRHRLPVRICTNIFRELRWFLRKLMPPPAYIYAWLFLRDNEIKNINMFERRISSESGEDGIIEIIFYKIGIKNKFFVEFGADACSCNTRLLRGKGWTGLTMDARDDNPPYFKKEFITAENINDLFKKYGVPKEFDLLSIDIDYNDFWVWKAIKDYSPRVVVIEYNASVPYAESRVVKYNPFANWDGTNYFGASLAALAKLGKAKGYTLVGCNNWGVNAFFVRNDLIKNNFPVKGIDTIYRPPKYGDVVNGRPIGHPPSKKQMMKY